jgi:hypothetical protein
MKAVKLSRNFSPKWDFGRIMKRRAGSAKLPWGGELFFVVINLKRGVHAAQPKTISVIIILYSVGRCLTVRR